MSDVDTEAEKLTRRVETAWTGRLSRREFVQKAGLAAVGLGAGPYLLAACGGGAPSGGGGGGAKSQLTILQWSHFVPRYDTWFDAYVKQWGEANNVNVKVDHINQADLPARTAAEINAGSGHDLIEWIAPPSALEPSVLDLTDVVQEAEKKYGSQLPVCKSSTYNPTTKKYFGFCHSWSPDPGDYRKSLWTKVGMPNGPVTYDDLLNAGTAIKQQTGVRVGIGMSQEQDSNMAARALLWSYGASVQDANENVVLDSDATREAVNFMVKLFKQSMTNEIFSWTAASNNQGLVAGQLSYILNSISAYRTAQQTRPDIADDIFFRPALQGPTGKGFASEHVILIYLIPKWSKNVDKAKQFLLDLVGHTSDIVYQSELYNFPAFSKTNAQQKLFGSGGWLDKDPFGSHPANKLDLLKNAASWSVNVGYPGPSNAAIGEIFDTFVLPNMMASAARGTKTVDQAVSDAAAQCRQIFAKWRQRKLVGGSS
jgi:multiple sugar transport system substrate-binding protein